MPIKKVTVQFLDKTKKLDAFVLSKNLCLLKCNNRSVISFDSFIGKLSLTHIKTGVRLAIIKVNKQDALNLAEKLEDELNLDFNSSSNLFKYITSEKLDQIAKICDPYLVYKLKV